MQQNESRSHLMYSRFYEAGNDHMFQAPMTRRLLQYWREKAGARRHPAWPDINLIDIYDIAPNMMVRDAVDGGRDFLCRFCGTGLLAILGMDPTGRRLGDVYDDAGRDMMLERYRLVVEKDAPVRVVGYVRVVERNLPTGFECVMLPVGGDGEGVRTVMMVLDFSYEPSVEEAHKPEV